MGITHPPRARALASSLALTLGIGFLVGSGVTPAFADGVAPIDLSTQALPTVQVDGVVWSQTVVGNTVYVGGNFTTARPIAGGSVGRANVLAYNLSSGELISSFVANTNGQVRSITAAPGGSRIYIAGSFTSVDGQAHDHIAALDPASGSPIRGFAADLNSQSTAVVATSGAVYAIGDFTQANGVAVSKAAALSPATGATLEWKPAFGAGTMRAITVSPSGAVVLVGGSFTSVGGVHAGGMAALDAGSGRLLPWAASKVVDLGGDATGIWGLSTDGAYVYGTGWAYQDKWGENSLEGVVSMKWDTGEINWIEDCHGDSYSSSPMNGILYVASHAHYCANVPNGFGELPENVGHRATAFSVKAAGVLAHNTEQGPGYYQDFGGQPAPTLENFFPNLAVGNFTGQGQAAWSVTTSGNYVSYGGEFVKVNGAAQTGLVRFYEPASSPVDPVSVPKPSASPTPSPTPDPTGTPTTAPGGPTTAPGNPTHLAKPGRVSTPNAVALGPTKVAVKWSAPKGAASAKLSKYVIKAYQGKKVVKTIVVSAKKRIALINGLHKSTAYRVGVAARNASGTGKQSVLDPAKTSAKGKNVSASKRPSSVKKPTVSTSSSRVRVHWHAAATSGALSVSSYQIRVTLHGKTVSTFTASAPSRSKLVKGLKRHTGYVVSVRARNWAGWSAWSLGRSAHTA